MLSRSWVLLILLGCSEPSPVEKCDTLIDELCDRAVECFPNAGTHTQCVQEVQQGLPCGAAKDVTASYDRCIDQIETFSCAVLFPVDSQTHMQTLELPAD